MDDLTNIKLYAWIGKDEMGSGKIGLKQAKVPAGMIPIVTIALDKANQEYIAKALDEQGKTFGNKIYLCEFAFKGIVRTVGKCEKGLE